MKLDLDALIVLNAIDEYGGVHRAAEMLHRVPSTVSYTVQKLEQRLGTTLFDRKNRRLRPTRAGRELIELGRALLQQATDIERRLERIGTGWEMELRVAVSDLIPKGWVLKLLSELYQIAPTIRVTILDEVLAGTWDALVTDRADLVIGAVQYGPSQGAYGSLDLGSVELIFAVAPQHPLARAAEPLHKNTIRAHRVAVIPDSTTSSVPLTFGVTSNESVLKVPDMQTKREAQCLGLAVGHLPRYLIEDDLETGRLIAKKTSYLTHEPIQLAWREEHQGKGLDWFRRKLPTAEADWLIR